MSDEGKGIKESNLENYQTFELLGSGTYGRVYKARPLHMNEIVAIKQISTRCDEEIAWAEGEIRILQKYRHTNLLRIKEVIKETGAIYIILDYYYRDLNKHLQSIADQSIFGGVIKGLPPLLVKSYLYQLLAGAEYLHKNGAVHLDLKPHNLLLNYTGGLVIGDFGATLENIDPDFYPKVYKEMVTLWYRAPELLFYQLGYTPAIDIWSIGCIFAQMSNGNALFQGDSESEQLSAIFRVLGTPNNNIWPGVESYSCYSDYAIDQAKSLVPLVNLDPLGIDLLSQMLVYDPSKRITASQALKHKYFDELIEICKKEIKISSEFPTVDEITRGLQKLPLYVLWSNE